MVRQKIFLGGFMAAGKTAVGRELARRLRLPFVDTDNLVEAQAHMEIHEIFFRHGEGAFRSLEAKVVEEVCSLEGVIVGLGGGVLANDELKRKVFSNGVLVVLDVTPDTVRRRVESQKGRRPLLEREDVESLMSRRQSAYAEAHLRVKTDDRSVEDVAEEIIKALSLNEPEEGSDFHVLWGRTEGRSYPVVVGRGVIPRYREIVPGLESVPPFLVSDYMTGALYADLLGERKGLFLLPRGEEAKTLKELERLYAALAECGVDRSCWIMALGGGTVGDLAGFAAATWMRGIDVVQCPTTLLAQVDSSIGGKTAIDLPQGKNLVGAFHQPRAVIADVDLLQTLPEGEYRQGLGEVVKYGLGEDFSFFRWLLDNAFKLIQRDPLCLEEVVRRCIAMKLAVVEADEREQSDLRSRLNLGHTVAHALEASSGYGGWKHGDAVAVGLVVATHLACAVGECGSDLLEDVVYLLRSLGLPTAPDRPWEEIVPYLMRDKKFRRGRPRLVIPREGKVCSVRDDIPLELLERAYNDVRAREVAQ